ncbi:MAG: hypothetical protein M1835_005928 [Candelina submexicana]|nr:MAG: hypothetical protein M1835_005928 [Candelina submexicana]
MNRLSVVAVLALGLLADAQNVGSPDMDPIKNMCVRTQQQSTVRNGTLYIDGGLATFRPLINSTSSNSTNATSGDASNGNATTVSGNPTQAGNITLGYNNFLIEVDLSQSWDWKTNISEKAESVTAPNSVSPPTLVRGALFQGSPDDNSIYLYGGTTSWWATPNQGTSSGFNPPTPQQYSLWSYDTVAKKWDNPDISAASQVRPNSGAYAEAPDLGLAFWFNGMLDSGSSSETMVFGDNTKVYFETMIVIDTNKKTARNLSTSAVTKSTTGLALGAMQYVPGVSDKGILVQIGGSDKTGKLIPMDHVNVFDVNSLSNSSTPNGRWYSQPTTGDAPSARVEACAVTVSAQDGSSHNIYLYGGRGGGNQQYFDQVYVLSIPSFKWTKVYEGSSPRFGHTCHFVGKRQMITVGGTWVPSTAQSLAIPGTCDTQTKGVNVFDLSAATFGSVYNANAAPYEVPAKVISAIGGNSTGGSILKYPEDGYAKLIGTYNPPPEAAPSPTSHAGAIAGGVIGGIAGIALIATALWFFLLRRRPEKKHELDQHTEGAPPPYVPEKDVSESEAPTPYERSQYTEMPTAANRERQYAEMEAHRGVEVSNHREPVEMGESVNK